MNFIGEYLRKNVTSIIKNRGAWIFNYGDFVRLDQLDRKAMTARYIVRSESGRGAYTVHIMNYDKSSMKSACTCNFSDGVCKHSVAAMMHLEKHLQSNPREFNPAVEEFAMPSEIDLTFLMSNAHPARIESGTKLQQKNKVNTIEQKEKYIAFEVKDDTAKHIVRLLCIQFIFLKIKNINDDRRVFLVAEVFTKISIKFFNNFICNRSPILIFIEF